jgi:predicted nuclease of predicted toxin-antitoxin system
VRILLDECIDRRLAKEIDGHEVVTVPQAGWEGIKNGEWLALAQQQFDVLVTVDRNLSFQQNLPQFNKAVVILQAPTNRLNDLRRLVPKLHGLLQGLVKGQFHLVNLEI